MSEDIEVLTLNKTDLQMPSVNTRINITPELMETDFKKQQKNINNKKL